MKFCLNLLCLFGLLMTGASFAADRFMELSEEFDAASDISFAYIHTTLAGQNVRVILGECVDGDSKYGEPSLLILYKKGAVTKMYSVLLPPTYQIEEGAGFNSSSSLPFFEKASQAFPSKFDGFGSDIGESNAGFRFKHSLGKVVGKISALKSEEHISAGDVRMVCEFTRPLKNATKTP